MYKLHCVCMSRRCGGDRLQQGEALFIKPIEALRPDQKIIER